MSIVPPPLVGAGQLNVGTTGFPAIIQPFPNITPFTYRDGMSWAETLEDYQNWILTKLVPHVNDQGTDIATAYNTASQALAGAMSAYTTAVTADRDAFNTTTQQALTTLATTISANATDMASKVAAASAAQIAAVAARDAGQQYAANTLAFQDATVKDIFNNPQSVSRGAINGALDGVYSHRDENWLSNYMDLVDARPSSENAIAQATWTTNIDASSIAAPKTIKPGIVGIGSNVTNWDGQNDTVFKFFPGSYQTGNGAVNDLALYGMDKPGGAPSAAGWNIIFEFVFNGDAFELMFYSRTINNSVMIEVDGKLATELPYTSRGSNSNQLLIKFASAKARTIRVYAGHASGFVGVKMGATYNATKPTNVTKRRIAIIGDSYVNGAGDSSIYPDQGTNNLETFAVKLLRYMQADEMLLAGIGGTGYVNGAPSSDYNTRLDYVLSKNPNVLVVYGSQNDSGYLANNQLRDAVTAFIAKANGIAEIYYVGSLLGGTKQISDVVKAAAATANKRFIDMHDFINGTGKIGNYVGDGNADFYRQADGVHPTYVAHKAIARTIFGKMRLNY